MGQLTDAKIRQWQEHAGLEPAHGARAARLERVAQCAFELIQVVELERSGIRDGDGQWHGSDLIGGLISDLRRLVAEDDAEWLAHSRAPVPLTADEVPHGD